MAKAGDFVQDLRLPLGFSREPRFVRIFKRFGGDGVFAVLLLWDWVAETFPATGRLEGVDADVIMAVCGIPEDSNFLEALMYRDEFLARDEGGTYYLPGWVEQQPYVAQAEERSAQARAAAEARWHGRPRRAGKNFEGDGGSQADGEGGAEGGDAGAMLAQCGSNAGAMQTQCPKSKSKSKSSPLAPRGVTAEEVARIYADVLPELPQPREVTDKMRREIGARAKAKAERRRPEWWRWYFLQVRDMPYLMGAVKDDWQASLAWLVGRAAMDKVLGGQYQRRDDAPRRPEAGPARARGVDDEAFARAVGAEGGGCG